MPDRDYLGRPGDLVKVGQIPPPAAWQADRERVRILPIIGNRTVVLARPQNDSARMISPSLESISGGERVMP